MHHACSWQYFISRQLLTNTFVAPCILQPNPNILLQFLFQKISYYSLIINKCYSCQPVPNSYYHFSNYTVSSLHFHRLKNYKSKTNINFFSTFTTYYLSIQLHHTIYSQPLHTCTSCIQSPFLFSILLSKKYFQYWN